MVTDGIFCAGTYRVETESVEMRMSHMIAAPLVTRVADGTAVLDLTQDIWDLQDVREEGEVLVLVMRKYPGLTNDVEVRILPGDNRFDIAGRGVTREELMAALGEYP